MNKRLFLPSLIILLACQTGWAQIPEDALRMSWNVPSGSARNQAIGGAMGSLGGEFTSLFVNPAGLGLYKTSEFVITPGLDFMNSKGSFRGTDANADKLNRFNLGTTGFVFGWSDPYSKWTSKAFSIGINRMANFNNNSYYKGTNDYSSFSEVYAEEFSQSGLKFDDVYNSNLSLATKMAVYTYLIDTATVNGIVQVLGRPEYLGAINQAKSIETRGGITELSLGFASNMNDKIFIGISIGVPIFSYERNILLEETDPTGDPDNNFNFARYREKFTSKGAGVNAKLGIIIKPAEQFRLGFALHSPTIYGLKEKTTSSMSTDLDLLFGTRELSIIDIDNEYYDDGNTPEYKYDLVSPWKFLLSGSYVIREVSDVTRQRGFITADVEYVTYGSSRFSSSDQYTDDKPYYDAVNQATKSIYKGAFNFRAGGELKFNTIMGRLGFAYYGNPYKDDALKAHKMNVSGGLGYRHKGIFLDLTYVQSLNKDVNFPYRLEDKANTFAELRDNSSHVILTLGFKL